MTDTTLPPIFFFSFDVVEYPLLSFSSFLLPCAHHTGVKTIDANVDAKTVVVDADESVSPQMMLEKLQKVRVGRMSRQQRVMHCVVVVGETTETLRVHNLFWIVQFSLTLCRVCSSSGPQPPENLWPWLNREKAERIGNNRSCNWGHNVRYSTC